MFGVVEVCLSNCNWVSGFNVHTTNGKYYVIENTKKTILPGGNLLFSMSIATTLMISTQMGQSNVSASDLTKATADKHWVSKRRRSG